MILLEVWFRYKILFMILIIILLSLIFGWEVFGVFFALLVIVGAIISKKNGIYTEESNKRIIGQNSFRFSKYLTVISYHLMKADGKIHDNEKSFMIRSFTYEFGKARANFFMKNIEKYTSKISFNEAVNKIDISFESANRVQLLQYLIGLVTLDKFLSVKELSLLYKISKYINIHYRTLDAVLARFNYTSEEDLNKKKQVKTYASNDITKHYKILELKENATEDEIKTAYRKFVKLYHPDKLTAKNKTNTKFAKEQFQLIQEAYEKIKKYKKIT